VFALLEEIWYFNPH